ncbi:hypothetical protein A0H81_03645 [Grifola frondosa]|uniref:Uncharacterized protein n=1 Tax=Grifola frondosa TaxID=5627 RepID=A0A1C7MJ45_GRIFR|nr:hypothetical protein A0H81_03645 [Grifola frondosa]
MVTYDPDMMTRSARIEQIFQKVEEQSEQRARVEEVEQQSTPTDFTPFASNAAPKSSPYIAPALAAVQDTDTSVCVQATDLSLPADPLDEELVTQMKMIVQRPLLGRAVRRMLARRLSLSRSCTHSRDILGASVAINIVIKVSVEEATVQVDMKQGDNGEVAHSEYPAVGEAEVVGLRATVCVGNVLHMEEGRDGEEREKRTSVGAEWVEKARELGMRLKLRSTGRTEL